MANDDSTSIVPVSHDDEADPGTAVERSDALRNPGLPPHRPRVTDLDPKAARKQERLITLLFYVSLAGSVFSMAAYFAFPIAANDLASVRLNNLMIGLGLAFALLAIGVAAVHWGKVLMVDHEGVDIRHPVRGDAATRARAVDIMRTADKESGFNRRVLIRNGMIASIAALPFPAIFLFRDLGPASGTPGAAFSHTVWKKGTRLVKDPTGDPILASDVTIGSAFQVIPEGILDTPDYLEKKGKAAVLLMRLEPGSFRVSEDRKTWNYNGILAYSKICTHVGCPVALYEQQTHHLLCPCHQSQFDITNEAAVIFGPAVRPLPQLPITVDNHGYLVAQSDFTEPVGPSFWERTGDYPV